MIYNRFAVLLVLLGLLGLLGLLVLLELLNSGNKFIPVSVCVCDRLGSEPNERTGEVGAF
jgi:hypothetical protein